MAVELLPSVLARTSLSLQRRWRIASVFGRQIHLDLEDQSFVSGRTVGPAILKRLSSRFPIEAHCMTRHPEKWLEALLHLKISRVIIHVELGAALKTYIALFHSHRWPVCLAINPSTPMQKLTPWLRWVDGVQVMTVHPGRYGAPFQPKMVERIRTLHQRYPRLPLAVDGAMTPKTIPGVIAAGATRVIVGSYLQRAAQPRQAWQQLQMAVRQK